MKITSLQAYSVAIPFIAPIFSAFGVSYPARLRTFIKVHTDAGLVGWGETGSKPTHQVTYGEQQALFENSIGPAIIGEDPFDYRRIMRKLRYIPESIAVETACWDLMGQAAGVPVYRLLGGEGHRERIPLAGYFFFRGADQHGENEVNLDNCVDHARWLVDTYGFDTLKMKLGVYDPMLEADAVRRVREALGPGLKLRIDPNGAWSLPTARRVLKRLEDCDLEYVEEPIRYIPARRALSTQDGMPSLNTLGLAALRRSTATPIAIDGAYRIDLLYQAARDEAGDVVLGDIQGSYGIRGLHDFFTVAETLGLTSSMHSGSETGLMQVAKLHVAAAHPEIRHAGDAIYHEYTTDVLAGGRLTYQQGAMAVPQEPGLGVALDEAKLAELALTPEKHADYDRFWADIKHRYHIPLAGHDLLVRHF